MRFDTATFHSANVAPQKSPRFVVAIIFDVASIYITSHTGITTVPGVVIDGALRNPSAISQRIVPDEGRTEIGAMSFDVVDLESQLTEEFRDKLAGGAGLRGKEVRLYVGYEGMDFTAFQRFQTQVVSDVSFDDGTYHVQCRDITREQRKEIFEPKRTTLRDTVSASDTTIPVYDTSAFAMVRHGISYSDAPSATVGYIKIDNEIIRYTGKTADSFTGCTRGVFNTVAVAHEVDSGTDAERRPKVEEYIYLELPSAKMIYAILTGVILSSSATAGNLAPNPSFEVDANSNNIADDWGSTAYGTGLTIERTRVSSPTIDGSWSHRLNITAITPPTSQAAHSTVTNVTVDVAEGQAYTASVYGQTSTLDYRGRIQIDWRDSGGSLISSSLGTHTFSATSTWERYSVTATAPAGAVTALLRAGIVRPNASDTTLGNIVFDAYQFEEGSTASDWTPDGPAFLPDHWHLGIDPSWVRLSDFSQLGEDLWDPTLDTNGFVARFAGLTKTDGKKFLESELYQLMGCYPVIYSDGTIGIKRMNHVLADAPYVVELSDRNTVSWSALKHEMNGMHNAIRVNWNHTGEEFTRSKFLIDAASVSAYGQTPIKELSFKGLHGSRHTDALVAKRLDALRDRYTWPPETMEVTVLPSLNRLEVGDIVRVKLPNVRDFAGEGDYIDRSFEIQQKSEDFATGNVTMSLFGSTGRASVNAPTDDASPLPDAFYTAEGVNLDTVCTIVEVGGVGVIQAGTYDLAGHADMNDEDAIYYYDGDLELADGATLTVNDNVQIRVQGFFTINGDIDGVGRGKAGVASAGGFDVHTSGTPGFIGNSRGMDGVEIKGGRVSTVETVGCAFTQGLHTAFPYLELTVDGDDLIGIPSDLRGTSGGAGGKVQSLDAGGGSPTVVSQGGTGGDSGAGLAIICRGLAFGASGSINLSGGDSAATSTTTAIGMSVYPGAGGAGSPGGLLILLDGAGISLPDVGGHFIGACGAVPINGSLLPSRGPTPYVQLNDGQWPLPGAGYLDESIISNVDMSNAAHRIQYIPETQTPAEDQDELPPAPTSLSVSAGQLENTITIGMPPAGTFDVIEIYAAITNDRSGATLVDSVGGSTYRHQLTGGVTRYYWVRSRRGNVVSAFYPSSSTGGISGTTFARFVARGNCQIIGDVARKVGGVSAYDSDVYSPDQYLNGCFVTFRADQTNLNILVGLNSDPATDSNYTGIDYAWLVRTDATCDIYESGVLIGNFGAYTTSTVFEVRYNGRLIQYFKGGALVRQVPVQNLTLFMDSSFQAPGAQISALQFGPLNAVTPSPWIARGNCIAGVTTARKEGGSSAWDSDVYSIDSYPVCHIKFKPSGTSHMMIGLSVDPVSSQSYEEIDFAWYVNNDGNVYIYESGSLVGSSRGAYLSSTELAITYDGSDVRYYKDRVLIETTSASSLVLYADSSFYDPDSAVDSFHFGPGTALEAVGTPGIEDGAATAIYSAQLTGPSDIGFAGSGTIEVFAIDVPAQSFEGEWIITGSYEAEILAGSALRSGTARQVDNGSSVETAFAQQPIPLPSTRSTQVVSGTVEVEPGFINTVGIFMTGSSSPSCRFWNLTVRAEFIKK
jgi:hypothetical protein